MQNFTRNHLNETIKIVELLDDSIIEKMVDILNQIRKNEGRLFFLGKITAAAVTGPAKHPLPASSVPASRLRVYCVLSIC